MNRTIVIDHSFDDEMLAEFDTLRETRLGLAIQQLENVEKTMDQLIERGLIEEKERQSLKDELRLELEEKVSRLRNSYLDNRAQLHVDDILFYADLVAP